MLASMKGNLWMKHVTGHNSWSLLRPFLCADQNAFLYTGLGWIGLDWVGLGWIGLDWVGLGWIGLDWVGLGWIGLVSYPVPRCLPVKLAWSAGKRPAVPLGRKFGFLWGGSMQFLNFNLFESIRRALRIRVTLLNFRNCSMACEKLCSFNVQQV